MQEWHQGHKQPQRFVNFNIPILGPPDFHFLLRTLLDPPEDDHDLVAHAPKEGLETRYNSNSPYCWLLILLRTMYVLVWWCMSGGPLVGCCMVPEASLSLPLP